MYMKQILKLSIKRSKIAKLYLSGLSSREVGKKVNLSHAWVLQLLKKENIERRLIIPISNPTYKKLTEAKAYLLGVLCGDGCVFSGIEKKKSKFSGKLWHFKSYIIYLSVADKDFRDEFAKTIEIVYGAKPYLSFIKAKKEKWSDIWTARIKRKSIYADLTQYKFGTKTWRVPKTIVDSNREKITSGFLRGFFDSEGSVSIGAKSKHIRCDSTNFKGICQIKKLLNKLEIKATKISNYKKKNCAKCYYLCILNIDGITKFYRKVNFSIKRKEAKLIKILNSTKKISV